MVSEEVGLSQIRNISRAGTMFSVRWRLVNHAGAVIDYVIKDEKSLNELLEHIKRYRWRGCIEYSTYFPAHRFFEADRVKELVDDCRKYRDCSVGIKWDNNSYYELSGYDRYTLVDDPEYFEDEDNKRHTGYILLLESDLFREAEYFYLNDDPSGAY